MATHTTDLTAPFTAAGTSPFTFIIYKENNLNTFTINSGTASGDYAGYDTNIAFAFSTDVNATKYPYDTSLLYALQETPTDHDVTIYFYTAGRTSLTASTPEAYSQDYLQITFHIFQDPTSSLEGTLDEDGSLRTDAILSAGLTKCYSAKLVSNTSPPTVYNYVRKVKCTTALPAISVESPAEAGTYNWYIYYAAGYNASVTADSSYLSIKENSPTLDEKDVIDYIPVNTAYRIGVRPVCWVNSTEHEGQLYLTATQYCVAPAPDIDIAHIQNYSDGKYDADKLIVDTNDPNHPYTNDSLSYIYNTIVVPFTYDTGLTLNFNNSNIPDSFTVSSLNSALETNHQSDIVNTSSFERATPTGNGQSGFSMILTVNITNPNAWTGGALNTFTFGINYGTNTTFYSAALRRTYDLQPTMSGFIGSTASNPYHLLTAEILSIPTTNSWYTPPGWCYVQTSDSAPVSGKTYYRYGNGWEIQNTWSTSTGIYERKVLTNSPKCSTQYTITLNNNSVSWDADEAEEADSWHDRLDAPDAPEDEDPSIHTWTTVYDNLYTKVDEFYPNENDIKGNKQGTLTCTITTHLGEVFTNTVPFYITLDEAPVVESATLQMRTTDDQYVDLADRSDIYTGEYIRFYFTCKTYNRQNITIQPQISRASDNTWSNYGSSQTYTPATSGVTGAYRGIVNSALYYPNQATPSPLGDITNNSACQFRLVVTMTATNKTVIQTINGTYHPQPSYAAIWSNFSGEFNVSQNKGITLNSKLSWLGYDSAKVSQASIDYNYILNPDVAEPTWLPILTSPPDGPSVVVKNALIGNGRATSNSDFEPTNNPPIIYVQASVKSYLTDGGTFPKINNNAYTPYGDGTRTTYGPIIAVACALNTVAYRRNRIGINVDAFDTNNDSATLVKIQGLQSISQVVFNYLGTGGSEIVGYVDVHDESVPGYAVGNGFLFDGGTYSYNS